MAPEISTDEEREANTDSKPVSSDNERAGRFPQNEEIADLWKGAYSLFSRPVSRSELTTPADHYCRKSGGAWVLVIQDLEID
jgi:hypothetical protein